jgi:hypothetical protein
MTVVAAPGSQGAVFRFGVAGLDHNQDCTVQVSNGAVDPTTGQPYGTVSSATSSEGFSTRLVVAVGLQPSTTYTANAVCGTVASGSVEFTTVAAVGGTVTRRYQFKPNALLGASKVSVYATRLDSAMDVNVVHTNCTPGPCTVNLNLVSGGSYSIVHAWETGGDVELVRSSRPQLVTVP